MSEKKQVEASLGARAPSTMNILLELCLYCVLLVTAISSWTFGMLVCESVDVTQKIG